MNKNIYMEKYYRLKYFYHIKIDKMLKQVNEKCTRQKTHGNYDSASKFFIVFQEILAENSLFSSYILSNGSFLMYSFFNDTYPDDILRSDANTLLGLCRISLFHNCIIHGFENLLANSTFKNEVINIKFNKYPRSIPLSGATDRDIQRGLFSCLNAAEKYHENVSPIIYKKYCSTYYPRLFRNRTYYSYHILFKESLKSLPSKHTVPVFRSNPLLFLFKNKNVQLFDKALQGLSADNIVRKYKNLEGEANRWKEDILTDNLDILLFDMVIEPYYGFKLFKSVGNLLSQTQKAPQTSTDELTNAALDSQIFREIIGNYLSSLPVVYNRFIFLEYASYAALHSDNLSAPSYPPLISSAIGQRHSRIQQTKDHFLATAVQRIGSFLRMLNYCTIPMLNDLWDVLTSELNDGVSFTLKDYTDFLKSNYKFVTADYSALYKAHPNFWKDELKENTYSFKRIYNRFAEFASKKELLEQTFPLFLHQVTTLEQFSALIKSNCQTPIKHRLSVDKIVLSQSADYADKTRYSTEYDLFEKRYINGIFDFIERYNPDVPF